MDLQPSAAGLRYYCPERSAGAIVGVSHDKVPIEITSPATPCRNRRRAEALEFALAVPAFRA